DRSKLLDPNEHFEDNDIEEDLKDFTVVTKTIPLQLQVVSIYFAMSNMTVAALHVTIPDLKIKTFCNFSQYKADMQFNERTIYVTDILLQMKLATIKNVFAKYRSDTDFRMT
ncbi:4669_t:CDS:2, partial [Funneliformis geosporum]